MGGGRGGSTLNTCTTSTLTISRRAPPHLCASPYLAHLWPQIAELVKSARVWPAINQCSLSIGYHDDETMAYCDKLGIGYMAYALHLLHLM